MSEAPRWLKAVFVVLVAVDAALAGADAFLRWKISRATEWPGAILRPPAGVTASGKLVGPAAFTRSGCHAIRYTSRFCPACAPEVAEPWNELAAALARRGCDIAIVSPDPAELPLSVPAAIEFRAVDMEFARESRFTATPITVVANRDGNVVWSFVGAFTGEQSRNVPSRIH